MQSDTSGGFDAQGDTEPITVRDVECPIAHERDPDRVPGIQPCPKTPPGLSPPGTLGPSFTGITGDQGPGR